MNLFIDTSNKYIILSLFEDEIVDCEVKETNKNQSEIFMTLLNDFLVRNKLSLKEITKIYFSAGPGSFTGIRVGLSIAKALQVSGYNNVYTLHSLETLIADYQNDRAIIDARGGKYYYQEVKDGIFLEPELILESEIEFANVKTYDSEVNNIAKNIINLVKNKRFKQEIASVYIKDAF